MYQPKLNGESFKITFEVPQQKLLTLLCFLRRNKTLAILSLLLAFKVFQVIRKNAYIDFEFIAKDLISIHEVCKKLLQCAQFGKCAFCGDIVRAKLKMNRIISILHSGCGD